MDIVSLAESEIGRLETGRRNGSEGEVRFGKKQRDPGLRGF